MYQGEATVPSTPKLFLTIKQNKKLVMDQATKQPTPLIHLDH